MLGKGKQIGGFFLAPFIYQNRAITKHIKKIYYKKQLKLKCI